jgi:glycosyltransferase involved in cell wall biosynthesis
MRLLVLSAWCPFPADNGTKLRKLHLLRGLARHHQIDLLAFAPELPGASALDQLQRICDRVELLPESPFTERPIGRLRQALSTQPRSILAHHSPEMVAAVRRRVAEPYDLVIAFEVHMAPYALELPRIPRLLEEVELAALQDQYAGQEHLLQRLRYGLTWWKTRRYVRSLLEHFAAATVVSQRELALLQPLAPRHLRLAVVPNGVDTAVCNGEYGVPEPNTLIYPGALAYDANFDAVSYFARAVLPRIRTVRPNARLRITGHARPEQVAALTTDGLEFTGYLDDVRPAVANAWAEVVPLRKGGGTRLKVLESLALGTPVIATSKGVEGLDLVPERDFLLADTPDDFAAQTLRLLGSPALRNDLAQAGRSVAVRYDWRVSIGALEQLISQTVMPPHRVADSLRRVGDSE